MSTKICTNCANKFEVSDADLKFYEKVSPTFAGKKYQIPAPTLCPDCRQQRRLAWRNERNLYHRKCDLTGKQIISIYSADKPYKAYNQEDWLSDKWDGLDCGMKFDFEKTFFEQFKELLKRVPLPSAIVVNCENCEYTNASFENKDCYLSFDMGGSKDVFYSRTVYDSKDSMDCLSLKNGELCYENTDCSNCYSCLNSQNCHNSSDLNYCFDCQSCQNCTLCTNLRNKTYCINNIQYTKEEYNKKVKDIDTRKMKDLFKKLKEESIHRFASFSKVEDSSGDRLINCKNAHEAYGCDNIEDGKFLLESAGGKDFYDDSFSGWGSELSYETLGNPTPYHSHFVIACGYPKFLEYCLFTHNSQNCFGCIGLKRAQYCILNKQYSKEEYEELVPKIIGHMQNNGEWGEFFPAKISPFAYNESVAQEYFPLSKEEVAAKNYQWKDEEDTYSYQGPKVEIPEKIEDVSDEICDQILTCEQCAKHYKIIKQELKLYRKLGVPVPKNCPNCRHLNRMSLRNPRKLWDRNCDKCGKEIKTSYAPERPEIVYCEKCYLAEVY